MNKQQSFHCLKFSPIYLFMNLNKLPTELLSRDSQIYTRTFSAASQYKILKYFYLQFTPLFASSDRHLSTNGTTTDDPLAQIMSDISPLFTECIRDCPSVLTPAWSPMQSLFEQFGTNWCLFRVKIFSLHAWSCVLGDGRNQMTVGNFASGRKKRYNVGAPSKS